MNKLGLNSNLVWKENSRPLILFGFEGQKVDTLLEHKVCFQRNENMTTVKVQLCFLYYSMKNNQKDSVNFWLNRSIFFETGVNNGQNLVNIVKERPLSCYFYYYLWLSTFTQHKSSSHINLWALPVLYALLYALVRREPSSEYAVRNPHHILGHDFSSSSIQNWLPNYFSTFTPDKRN